MNLEETEKIINSLINTFILSGNVSLDLRNKGLKKKIKSDNTPDTNGDIEVNNLLRGFFVPNGKSEITLEFKPFDLKYSSLITYSSLIIILILFITSLVYNKDEKP